MNKQEYKELLKLPEWQAKRMRILKRDQFICTGCGKKTRLQVHHKYYESDKLPWEYPDKALVTLCSTCHKKEHEGRKIGTFFKKTKKKVYKKKKAPVPIKNKGRRPSKNLSAKDKAIQMKYNSLKKEGKIK